MTTLLVSLPNNTKKTKTKIETEEELNSKLFLLIDKFLEGKEKGTENLLYSLFEYLNKNISDKLLPPGAGLSSKSVLVKDYLQQKYSHLLS
jgi:alpha-galactosidase